MRELFRDDGIEYLNKRSNEILTAIHVPAQDGRWRASYRKLRRRESFDFPVLGVAAAARIVDGIVEEARIVITGAGSRPHDAAAAAALLVGKRARRSRRHRRRPPSARRAWPSRSTTPTSPSAGGRRWRAIM